MDPITRAATNFAEQAAAFWQSGQGQLLLLCALPAQRLNLAKFLRAQESALDNRWPLVLFDAPFDSAAAYAAALCKRIAQDYAAVRDGVALEGVSLDEFPPASATATVRGVATVLEQMAKLLGARLDGVHLTLLPSRIDNAETWKKFVADLLEISFSKRARISVYDAPDGVLASLFKARAVFEVDESALLDYFRQAGNKQSAGPARPPKAPALTDEQRARVEQRLGRRLLEQDKAAQLRELLLDAAQHNRKSDHQAALSCYLAAQRLCQAEAAVQEESMVLMALASAYLTLKQPTQALASYASAARLAEAESLWPVASQAMMGSGAVRLMNGEWQRAAQDYEKAAAAAERAQVAMLRIEALRMAGTCHHQLGRVDDTVRCWQQAVIEGEALTPGLRAATTFPEVAADFIKLLRRYGLHQQAAHVESLARMTAPRTGAGAA
jgi:tetratricopeptide (TPR) repeat protein